MTLQTALLFPSVLLIILTAFQAGLYWYSQSAALAAAQEGVRVTAAQNGTVGAGVNEAGSFLKRVSGTLVQIDQVGGSRTASAATISVRATVVSLIPGLPLTVTATASLPSEEYSR